MQPRRLSRSSILLLVVLALFFAIDFHVGQFSTRTVSHPETAIVQGSGTPEERPRTLSLHVVGADGLERTVAAELDRILVDRGVFEQVQLLSELPRKLSGAFLLVHIRPRGSFWSPLYVRRTDEITLFFNQGGEVDPWGVRIAADADRFESRGGFPGSEESCSGRCHRAWERMERSDWGLGLISYPAYRERLPVEVARYAADFVVEAVPPQQDPERWGELAMARARALWPANLTEQSFTPLEGCRGGVVMSEDSRDPGRWAVGYYDADQDAITATLAADDVMARVEAEMGGPISPDGPLSRDALSDHVRIELGSLPDGSRVVLRIAMEGCSLGPWQAIIPGR